MRYLATYRAVILITACVTLWRASEPGVHPPPAPAEELGVRQIQGFPAQPVADIDLLNEEGDTVRIHRPDLEAVFLSLTSRRLPD